MWKSIYEYDYCICSCFTWQFIIETKIGDSIEQSELYDEPYNDCYKQLE
jgi:hypothetical protein